MRRLASIVAAVAGMALLGSAMGFSSVCAPKPRPDTAPRCEVVAGQMSCCLPAACECAVVPTPVGEQNLPATPAQLPTRGDESKIFLSASIQHLSTPAFFTAKFSVAPKSPTHGFQSQPLFILNSAFLL